MSNTLDRNGFVFERTLPQESGEHEGGFAMSLTRTIYSPMLQRQAKSPTPCEDKRRLAKQRITTKTINELSPALPIAMRIVEYARQLDWEPVMTELEDKLWDRRTITREAFRILAQQALKHFREGQDCIARTSTAMTPPRGRFLRPATLKPTRIRTGGRRGHRHHLHHRILGRRIGLPRLLHGWPPLVK